MDGNQKEIIIMTISLLSKFFGNDMDHVHAYLSYEILTRPNFNLKIAHGPWVQVEVIRIIR